MPAIEFQNVSYAPAAGPRIFDRFTLTVEPGEVVALVGRSGAGKTTMMKLVNRLVLPDAGHVLADRITWFMQQLDVPNGLRAVGYTQANIPALVEGTLLQRRLTTLAPRPAGAEELGRLFEDAMTAW